MMGYDGDHDHDLFNMAILSQAAGHFPIIFRSKNRWIHRPPPVTVIMTMTAENEQGYIVEKDEEDRIP